MAFNEMENRRERRKPRPRPPLRAEGFQTIFNPMATPERSTRLREEGKKFRMDFQKERMAGEKGRALAVQEMAGIAQRDIAREGRAGALDVAGIRRAGGLDIAREGRAGALDVARIGHITGPAAGERAAAIGKAEERGVSPVQRAELHDVMEEMNPENPAALPVEQRRKVFADTRRVIGLFEDMSVEEAIRGLRRTPGIDHRVRALVLNDLHMRRAREAREAEF